MHIKGSQSTKLNREVSYYSSNHSEHMKDSKSIKSQDEMRLTCHNLFSSLRCSILLSRVAADGVLINTNAGIGYGGYRLFNGYSQATNRILIISPVVACGLPWRSFWPYHFRNTEFGATARSQLNCMEQNHGWHRRDRFHASLNIPPRAGIFRYYRNTQARTMPSTHRWRINLRLSKGLFFSAYCDRLILSHLFDTMRSMRI